MSLFRYRLYENTAQWELYMMLEENPWISIEAAMKLTN
jgi:hypothetical protein